MHMLASFQVDDVVESPTVDAAVMGSGWMRLMPRMGLLVILVSWFYNLFHGKAVVAKAKAKVKLAREQILPRSPKSQICPECYEVLEIL